jgi:hypothetical protein
MRLYTALGVYMYSRPKWRNAHVIISTIKFRKCQPARHRMLKQHYYGLGIAWA